MKHGLAFVREILKADLRQIEDSLRLTIAESREPLNLDPVWDEKTIETILQKTGCPDIEEYADWKREVETSNIISLSRCIGLIRKAIDGLDSNKFGIAISWFEVDLKMVSSALPAGLFNDQAEAQRRMEISQECLDILRARPRRKK